MIIRLYNNILDYEVLKKFCSTWDYLPFSNIEPLLENSVNRVAIIFFENAICGLILFQAADVFADVIYIYILPEKRGHDFSKKLWYFFEDHCRISKIFQITLEVKKTNISAIKFYEKMGLNTIHVRKKYYEGKIDAFVMTKNLNDTANQ